MLQCLRGEAKLMEADQWQITRATGRHVWSSFMRERGVKSVQILLTIPFLYFGLA